MATYFAVYIAYPMLYACIAGVNAKVPAPVPILLGSFIAACGEELRCESQYISDRFTNAANR